MFGCASDERINICIVKKKLMRMHHTMYQFSLGFVAVNIMHSENDVFKSYLYRMYVCAIINELSFGKRSLCDNEQNEVS